MFFLTILSCFSASEQSWREASSFDFNSNSQCLYTSFVASFNTAMALYSLLDKIIFGKLFA